MKNIYHLLCLLFLSTGLSNAQDVTLHINDNDYIGDNPVVMDVAISGADSLVCFQFTLEWDTSELTFQELGNFNLPGLNNSVFGFSLLEEGRLPCAWVDPNAISNNLPDGYHLFSIIFSPPCGTLDGATTVSFANFPTPAEVCNINMAFPPLVENGTLNYTCEEVGTIHAPVFNDLNQNALKDANEPLYPDATIGVEPSGLMAFSATEEGTLIHLLYGDYDVSYSGQFTPDWVLTTGAPSFDVTLDNNNPSDTVVFGVKPLSDISEMNSYIFTGWVRCHEWDNFEVVAKNEGTTKTEGTLWVDIDEEVHALAFIDEPDETIPPNRYGWHFTDLYPGHTVKKQWAGLMPGPPDFTLGDSLFFSTHVTFEDVIGAHESPSFAFNPVVECSYDPNDKQVSPNRPGYLTWFGEPLIYTIRFQNTGNAVAYDVVVKDTLSDFLDPNSFRFLSSSHGEVLSITLSENKHLTFTFNNIYLPDSTTNFDESQGYLSFKLDPLADLPEGALITNRAGIYFDNNPPIITNTTQNILAQEIIISTEEVDNTSPMAVFPNPTNNVVTIATTDPLSGTLELIDHIGKIIVTKPFESTGVLDLATLPAGVYTLLLHTAEAVLVERVVRM